MTSPLAMPALAAGLLACGSETSAPVASFTEAVGDFRCHRLNLHAGPPSGHGALVAKLSDDALHRLGGNVESNPDRAARRGEDRGVDADDIAVDVEGRAAGIALVDRRVDLDEVVIGTGA